MSDDEAAYRPYPPYSGDDATCTKCGGNMDRTYQHAGTRHLDGPAVAYGKGPEWMLRQCNECGYAWPEMCADAT